MIYFLKLNVSYDLSSRRLVTKESQAVDPHTSSHKLFGQQFVHTVHRLILAVCLENRKLQLFCLSNVSLQSSKVKQ